MLKSGSGRSAASRFGFPGVVAAYQRQVCFSRVQKSESFSAENF